MWGWGALPHGRPGLKTWAWQLSPSPPAYTHTRSLCRIWNPDPFADGALPCNLLRAFISGVIKAWLKTRASSSAAFRLTSTRAAGLDAGAGEPLPGPHEAPQQRPCGQGEGGRPRGAPGPPGCSAAAGAGWLRPPQRRGLSRLFPLWLFRKASPLTPPNFTFIFERAWFISHDLPVPPICKAEPAPLRLVCC